MADGAADGYRALVDKYRNYLETDCSRGFDDNSLLRRPRSDREPLPNLDARTTSWEPNWYNK